MQWLFWQIAGLGPMAGQNGHFNNYAPEKREGVHAATSVVSSAIAFRHQKLAAGMEALEGFGVTT
jgi:glutathione S-transferase